MINEQMSDSLKKVCLIKSKILFFSMFYMYTFFNYKKWAIRSFPLFWWAMWENRSGRSPKKSNVSELLRSLTKNERPWAIRSGRSEEMSDRERIAQVAHQIWANEWITRFLCESIIRSFLGKKRVMHSENRWAKSQPWTVATTAHLYENNCTPIFAQHNPLGMAYLKIKYLFKW